MKKIAAIIVLASFILISCQPDKQARLDGMIKKRDQLNEKILALKSEIDKDNPKEEKVNLVKTEKVETSVFKHYIEVQGTVESDKNVFVPAQSLGLVTKIYVKEGDKVSKGQLLAETDGSILEKSLEQMESAYKFAKDVFERQEKLWNKQIGSEIQYLQAKNAKDNLEKQYGALKEQYKLTKLYAPISGTVDDIMLKEGESAAMGGIRVIQLSDLKISASVSESYINEIQAGDTVSVNFPTIDKTLEKEISSVSKYIDGGNRTFNVEIKLPKEFSDAMPNMLSIVKINDYYNEKAIVIPVNVIQRSEKGNFVFVAKKANDTWISEKRIVTLGKDQNNKVEVLDGIEDGDLIITTGYQNLSNGSKIKM